MSTTERVLTGPRLSSLAMCERRPVYEYLDVERDPIHPNQERMFRRGRRLGQLIADEIRENLAEDGREVEAEREIPWGPDGQYTGHADVFVHGEGLTIEVVSTAGADLPLYKVRQVVLYHVLDPESHGAAVLSIDPSTNEERFYPIDVDGPMPDGERTWREWAEEVLARVYAAMAAGDPGMARVALDHNGEQVESPSGFPCFDCPFKRPCWANWEPLPKGQVPEELHAAVVELAMIEDKLASVRRADHLEERREELRELLAGQLQAGTDYTAPGFQKIRFSEVKGRTTFSLSAFEKAGHRLPDEAKAFISVGRGHLRWTITREQAS